MKNTCPGIDQWKSLTQPFACGVLVPLWTQFEMMLAPHPPPANTMHDILKSKIKPQVLVCETT